MKVAFCNEFYEIAQKFEVRLQRTARRVAPGSARRAFAHGRIPEQARFRDKVYPEGLDCSARCHSRDRLPAEDTVPGDLFEQGIPRRKCLNSAF